jgi:hypothetical protein
VGRSLASHRTIAHGLGQRLSRAAGFGKASHDRFSIAWSGVPESDPTVETNPIKRSRGRIALCPPRIGEVLLWRVRDGARPQEEGEPEDRSPATLERLAVNRGLALALGLSRCWTLAHEPPFASCESAGDRLEERARVGKRKWAGRFRALK